MTEKPKQARTWRRTMLPVSLVFNLFFVALIGGHLWRDHVSEPGTQPQLARALANIRAALSAPDAAAFTAVVHRDAPDYLAAAQQLTVARAQLEQQITAEPYNPEAVKQSLAAWQLSWDHFMTDFSNPLVDALAQVSPEGRRNLIAVRRRGSFGLGPPP